MSKRLDDSASATTLGRLSRRALLRCAGGLGALAAMPSVSLADDQYPTRNVNLVVPFPPGGSPDILSRLLGRKLSERFDKPFIIENRGGAGGSIAAQYVARSSSDGYTLMMGHIGTLAVEARLRSPAQLRAGERGCDGQQHAGDQSVTASEFGGRANRLCAQESAQAQLFVRGKWQCGAYRHHSLCRCGQD